jgi:hypothetical protein
MIHLLGQSLRHLIGHTVYDFCIFRFSYVVIGIA